MSPQRDTPLKMKKVHFFSKTYFEPTVCGTWIFNYELILSIFNVDIEFLWQVTDTVPATHYRNDIESKARVKKLRVKYEPYREFRRRGCGSCIVSDGMSNEEEEDKVNASN